MRALLPLRMLAVILIRNFAFSLIVFLVSYSMFLAGLVLFIEGLYVGFSVSLISRDLIVVIALLPHGIIEVLGYSLFALAGIKYHGGGNYARILVLGASVIVVAAFIETFISVSIARRLVGMFCV